MVLVLDRVNIDRKEKRYFSVRLNSMKPFRSGNLRYMADRFFEKACIREVFILNDRPLEKKSGRNLAMHLSFAK